LNHRVAEGTIENEEELPANDTEFITKKAKFEALTQCFWAPKAAADFRKQKEQEKLAKEKAGSQMGSEMGSDKDEPDLSEEVKSEKNEGPEYDALVPECWKEQLKGFEKLHIVKHRRVI
jgi:hypothetical protein